MSYLPARVGLLALAAALAGSGCGRQHGSEKARVEPGGEQTISVDAHDIAFRPKTISVEPHGEVVVTVRNTGKLSHTFTTDTPAGDVVLEPGDSRTVRFPARRTGAVLLPLPRGQRHAGHDLPGRRRVPLGLSGAGYGSSMRPSKWPAASGRTSS